MKRMKHPLHGFHHAYNSHEEAAMRANGWVDDLPSAAPQADEDLVVSPPGGSSESVGAAPTVEELRAQLDAKGIEYHPRAGIKKLQALLG